MIELLLRALALIVHCMWRFEPNPRTISYSASAWLVHCFLCTQMCGINLDPLAEHETDDYCAEALLSLQSAKEQELDRFYCPFPGCKRSFAELWRLKVHFRAPPNVRGSGKERGHGMRLTHCPKCGTALKIGGHHVRCSAREAARQHMQLAKKPGKRNAASSAAASITAAAPQAQQQPTQLQAYTMLPTHEQQHDPSAPAQGQQEQQLQSMLQQLLAQQPAAASAADASMADHDDDTQTYAYKHQPQQQHWVDQSVWYKQQQHQPQQPSDNTYYQHQQQLGCGHQAAVVTNPQPLQRLQELLLRVDLHLGHDQESAHPVQLHHCSKGSLNHSHGEQQQQLQLGPCAGEAVGGNSSFQQYVQQQHCGVRQEGVMQQPLSYPSSDSSASSATEGSTGDGGSEAGNSDLSAATTVTAVAPAAFADTAGGYSTYFALLAQHLQSQQQQVGSALQLQQQHVRPQQEHALLSLQLPPPQPLDCGLAADLSLQPWRSTSPAVTRGVTKLEGALGGDLSGLAGAAGGTLNSHGSSTAAGAGADTSSDQHLGLLQALLQTALAAATGSEGTTAAVPVPTAAVPLPVSTEAEGLQLLRERCKS